MVSAAPEKDYALLILAAGASRRMGQPKQLLPWGDNTLLGHTLEQAYGVQIQRKYLLLGARADQIMMEVDVTGFIPLVFAGWEDGMGSGIAYAVDSMLDDLPGLKGVMIVLADQPQVDSSLLCDMLHTQKSSGKALLASAYGEKSGVPAIITGKFVKHLTKLEGDQGARSLFDSHPESVHRYVMEVPPADIDDPETYRELHYQCFGTFPGT